MSVHAFPDRRQRAAELPLPSCIEAEQAVLGSILLRNGDLAAIAPHVGADDFGAPLHRAIFDVAMRLLGEGKPATVASLRPFLGDSLATGDMTIPQYLARLVAEASVPGVAVVGYAQLIRSVGARRRLVDIAAQLDEAARDVKVGEDAAVLATSFAGELQHVAAGASTDTTQHVGELVNAAMAMVDGVRSGEVEHRSVTTGYRDLDEAVNGLCPGELFVVGARPGMGKTMLMSSSARRCAERAGVGVLEFPLEVGAEQLTARHLADLAFRGDADVIAYRDVGRRAGELSDDQAERLRRAGERLSALPVVIDNRSRVTVPQIAAKVAECKAALTSRGVTLGVVFVDHLDFVQASDRYSGNRVQEIGEVCLGLKDLARSESVCVVLLCQLSRAVEGRPESNRRPGLADLRNSGDIEQVADVVALLYRPEYYAMNAPGLRTGDAAAVEALEKARGRFEVILAKVRSGPTRTVDLWCSPAASSVSSFERGRA